MSKQPSSTSKSKNSSPEEQPANESSKSILRTRPVKYSAAIGILSMVAIAPASAQTLGDVFCNTQIETLINTLFSALLGLGLPVSLFYTAYSGFQYMQAGGNPEAEREAKRKLKYGVMGLFIILLVIILPEIIDSIFGQVGTGFSECVKPF